MDKSDYQITKRFADLSNQADVKGIVLFSDFLNMNELSLLAQCKGGLSGSYTLYGGYEYAERQMVAFQPEALYYAWDFPITCVKYHPIHLKYADSLTHRDVLGALMHLGIERSLLGDIVFQEKDILVFCHERIADYLIQELTQIKHTQVMGEQIHPKDILLSPRFKSIQGNISSNRLDAFVAQACKLSRAKAATYILEENVFRNGKLLTNHNASLTENDILSLRGYGKLMIDSIGSQTRKGRLWVEYKWYQ